MKIQIYTIQSIEEAHAVIELGVHQIGLTPSNIGLPGEIDFTTARSIVDAVGDSAVTVALSVETDLDPIVAMVEAVQPQILHLCGPVNEVGPAEVGELRKRISDTPIMQAVSVSGPEAVDVARAYAEVADYLILDTETTEVTGIGASGETHDWSISRKIVEVVDIPVILAGGLSPENVAESIRAVQPWAVDSLTHTNRPLEGGGFRKDLDRIRQFVAAVDGAL